MVKELMTLDEFSDLYSIGRNKVYTEAAAGRLILTKVGRRTKVKRTDAEDWLKALPTVDRRE